MIFLRCVDWQLPRPLIAFNVAGVLLTLCLIGAMQVEEAISSITNPEVQESIAEELGVSLHARTAPKPQRAGANDFMNDHLSMLAALC